MNHVNDRADKIIVGQWDKCTYIYIGNAIQMQHNVLPLVSTAKNQIYIA